MTALSVSQRGWVKSEYAVLTRGDDFADTLCAVPLAKKYDAPILLTMPDVIAPEIIGELKRLDIGCLLIIGGEGAVSEHVADELRGAGIDNIERIWGKDRYETSVKVAERFGESNWISLATGALYPDALSISGPAACLKMPVLLTYGDVIPECVKAFIKSKEITRTYVIGGVGAISDNVTMSLPYPKRIGGADRYETNVLVLKEFFSYLDFSNIYAATGEDFPDAAAGLALAARTSSPVILVKGSIPEELLEFLRSKALQNVKIIAIGGETAVPSEAVYPISDYISHSDKERVVLSWGDFPQKSCAGEFFNINLSVSPIRSYVIDDILYVMEWTKDSGTPADGDIEIYYMGRKIEGAKGRFIIDGVPEVEGKVYITVSVNIKSEGKYNLTIYAETK